VSSALYDRLSASTGLRTTLFRDQDYRTPIIKHEQDTRPFVEENRRWANAYDPSWDDNAIGARRVASIPFVIWAQFERMGVVKGTRVLDEHRFLRLLSDPELRFLRTDNGRRLA
jgi:hypothetical protein